MANKPSVKISKALRAEIQDHIHGTNLSVGDFVTHAVKSHIYNLKRLSGRIDKDVSKCAK